jgi:crotonobetainyl-CoA:carnitine CoA-transferase CaiB-like acyl-CoA transferase
LEALIRWADVVHHNLRSPAARKLGIDEDAIRAINPTAVYCHASAYGPIGPRADWPGFDQMFQAYAGWEAEGGGEGNPPMWHRMGMMDHQGALASLVGTLLALHHRDRTGEGASVHTSILGAAVLTASETVLRADGTVAPTARLDQEQAALDDGYRIRPTDDGWLAEVAIPGLEPAVEPVRLDQGEAFFDDPANRAARLAVTYPSAQYGALEQIGAFWSFGDDLAVRLDVGPPALGEHTRAVLREVGLDDDTVDAMVESGAITDAGT